jgi:oxygen-independent coproporphyrinogen-3 oxidase
MHTLSIYVHIPFCRQRCNYCDFNTFAGMENFIPIYLKALHREIQLVNRFLTPEEMVHTIYFGGGTPSVLPVQSYEKLIDQIQNSFNCDKDMEISIEINPGTVDYEYLNALKQISISRLSIGVQSAIPEELKFLGRIHSSYNTLQTMEWAKEVGFRNINLDLMFGLPGQLMENWQKSLEFALRLNPQHLSLYALTIEPHTPLGQWLYKGLIDSIDEDLAGEMYEWAMNYLERQGFDQYEISNWSRVGAGKSSFQCRHNLQYWLGLPYLGFGAGAHSHYCNRRFENFNTIPEYIKECEKAFKENRLVLPKNEILIDQRTEMQEMMMVGLRLTQEGVSQERFFERFNRNLNDVFGKEIDKLIGLGLLEWESPDLKNLRLTHRGRMMGNQVFMQFVD